MQAQTAYDRVGRGWVDPTTVYSYNTDKSSNSEGIPVKELLSSPQSKEKVETVTENKIT